MVARLVFGVTVLLLVIRAFYGIDFNDESAYLAIPVQFSYGAVPFVDEISVLQLSGLFLVPPVKLFLFFFPSQEGILLFGRFLFLAAWVGTWVGLFLLLRRSTRFPTGFSEKALWWASLGWLPLVPVHLMGLSYNSFGLLFLTLGLASAWRYHRDPDARGTWLVSFFLSLSAWSYPGFSLALVPYLVLWWYWRKKDRARVAGQLLFGITPLFLLLLVLVLWVGRGNLITTVGGFSAQGQALSLSRLMKMVGRVLPVAGLFSIVPVALALVGFMYGAQKKWGPSFAARWGWSFALLFSVFISNSFYFGSVHYPYNLTSRAFFLLPLIVGAMGRKNGGAFLLMIWVPCALLGLLAALSSSSAERNFGLGTGPCLFFSLLWMGQWLEEQIGGSTHWARRLNPLGSLVVGGVLIYGLFFGVFFFDDPIARLTHRMQKGPYRFLLTSPGKGAFLENFQGAIESNLPEKAWVTFYRIPGGLLEKPVRNAAASVWIIGLPEPLKIHFKKIGSRAKASQYFVLMKRLFHTEESIEITDPTTASGQLVARMVRQEFTPTYEDSDLIIYRANHEAGGPSGGFKPASVRER